MIEVQAESCLSALLVYEVRYKEEPWPCTLAQLIIAKHDVQILYYRRLFHWDQDFLWSDSWRWVLAQRLWLDFVFPIWGQVLFGVKV